MNHRGRRASALYYTMVRNALKVLPVGGFRVAKRLMNMRLRLRPAIVRIRRGYWVVMPDAQSTWMLLFAVKEADIQHHIGSLFQRADGFIDCGANVGWYSFLASRYPAIESIIAVEPIHQSVRYMEFLKKLNGLSQLQIIRGCVSDCDGTVPFARDSSRLPESGYVIESPGFLSEEQCEVSPCYRLESILERMNPSLNRICIKIDVEGHEHAVLSRIDPQILARRVGSIIVEVHLYKFPDAAGRLADVCALVSQIGAPRLRLLAKNVRPGERRFWERLIKHYPLCELPTENPGRFLQLHSAMIAYVMAERGRDLQARA